MNDRVLHKLQPPLATAVLLPVRPRSNPGEATSGYMIRVAEANGYESSRQLWYGLKSTKRLFEALDLDKTEKEHLFGPFPGYWEIESKNKEQDQRLYGLSVSDFNHSHFRWCPLCLMDSKHIKGIWLLKLCPVCTEHKILLHENCPRCGKTQTLEYFKGGQCCWCRIRLTVGRIQPAPSGLMRIGHAMEQGMIKNQAYTKGKVDGLPMLTLRQWNKLVLYLGEYTENRQPNKPGQIAGLHQLEVASKVISNLAFLLDRWPTNFYRLLASMQQQQTSSSSLGRTFGKLMNSLFKQLNEPCFQFLRTAFESYVQQSWPGTLGNRNRSFKKKTITNHPQLTIKQAATMVGASESTLLHLFEVQPNIGYRMQSVNGRNMRTLHNSQISKVKQYTQHTLTLAEAAYYLGIPEHRVRTMIDAGLIKPLFNRKQVAAACWLIPIKRLKPFWFYPKPMTDDDQIVAMSKVLQNWKLTSDEWAALIRALMTKELNPLAIEPLLPISLGKVILGRQEYQHWLYTRRINSSGYLSVDQAARHLGLKQQVAYGLVHNKLLESESDGLIMDSRKISVTGLEKFKANYISLAEMAQAKDCSPRKLLHTINIKPVCGPQVDGTRQYFYRQIDIAEYL